MNIAGGAIKVLFFGRLWLYLGGDDFFLAKNSQIWKYGNNAIIDNPQFIYFYRNSPLPCNYDRYPHTHTHTNLEILEKIPTPSSQLGTVDY